MKASSTILKKPTYKINKNLKSHANDPFVKEKMAQAIEILKTLQDPVSTTL